MVPKLDDITRQLAGTPSVIVSSDGKVLFRAQAEYRKPAKFEDIPKIVRDATLAAEDIRFYDHPGVDFRGLARALFENVKAGHTTQGGSTITMQLAKRVYTGTERSFNRKLKDMALAVQIERSRTKDQVLTMYMNQAFYGSGAYGIGAAASVYFNKSLDQLTLSEAALLARLVQRPSYDNPFANLDRAIENRDIVLARMREAGMITQKQYDQAINERVRLAKRMFGSGNRTLRSPYFVGYVLDYMRRNHPEIDLQKGGYKIETTLDSRLDDLAQKEVSEIVTKYRRQKLTTGAFVLMDADGQILAMAGGSDYRRNSYNMVSQGKRQPGSAFKPFVYATALAKGVIGPHDQISNEQLTIEDPVKGTIKWPKNSKPVYGGTKSITTAIAGSINVCAAHVIQDVGPQTVIDFCRDIFGFRSPMEPYLPLALGASSVNPLEMAQAYSVFMTRGDRVRPFGIKRIVGPDGEVIEEFEPKIDKGVLDAQVAGWMDGYLKAVVTGGTGRGARSVPNARGKTGTTSDHLDAWFCGYTNSLVGIGWVASERWDGNSWVYDPMSSTVFGGKVTIQIWTSVMKEAVGLYEGEERKGQKKVEAVPPPDVTAEPPVDDAAGTDTPTIAQPPLPPDEGVITGDETLPPPTGEASGAGTTNPTTANAGDSKPTPGKKPASGRRNGGPDEVVSVEVCAESGQLATAYCPETLTKTTQRSRAPKTRCQLHGP